MKNVKLNHSITPQSYIESITGKYYFFQSDDDFKEIHKILRKEGFENKSTKVRTYKLGEINKVVESGLKWVLISCWKYPQAETLIWFPEKLHKINPC